MDCGKRVDLGNIPSVVFIPVQDFNVIKRGLGTLPYNDIKVIMDKIDSSATIMTVNQAKLMVGLVEDSLTSKAYEMMGESDFASFFAMDEESTKEVPYDNFELADEKDFPLQIHVFH